MYKVITTIKSTKTAIYDEDGELIAEWANDDGIVCDEDRYEMAPDKIEEYFGE